MGRPKGYSTEQLLDYIRRYLIDHNNFEHLKVSAVAAYCNDILKLQPRVYYQYFQRDPVVRQWIEDYNKRLDQQMAQMEGHFAVIPGQMIDPDQAVRQLGAQAKDEQKKIRDFVTKVNQQIFELMERNRKLEETVQKKEMREKVLIKENQMMQEQIKNLGMCQKASGDQVTSLKKNIMDLRSQLAEYKAFVEEHITNPIILGHMYEVGILTTKPTEMPENPETLLHPSHGGRDDLSKILAPQINKTRDLGAGEKKDEKRNVNIPYVTKKETELYDKFSSLCEKE